MEKKGQRIEAIRQVKQGESVRSVCARLGRSRTWYYYWEQRYRKAGLAGLEDRRGKHEPWNKTPEWQRDLILEIRDRLVAQADTGASFRGIGAPEIVRELVELGVQPPHWTTVHRILKLNQRIPEALSSYCPRPENRATNDVHQVDIWPVVLKGGEKLFFFHLVDVASWYPAGLVSPDKTSQSAMRFLVESWQEIGVPKIAQFDNEWCFTGGRWAHRLGRIVRLCLALGVQPWFIPFETPKRNGFVERFHGECDQLFWSRNVFANQTEVQDRYPDFMDFFRQHRRLPAIHKHTPAEMRLTQAANTFKFVHADCELHRQAQLPIVAGIVNCVRLADHNGKIVVLNRPITLGTKFARSYVLARIDTTRQSMSLYQQPAKQKPLVKIESHSFSLEEPVLPLDSFSRYLISHD